MMKTTDIAPAIALLFLDQCPESVALRKHKPSTCHPHVHQPYKHNQSRTQTPAVMTSRHHSNSSKTLPIVLLERMSSYESLETMISSVMHLETSETDADDVDDQEVHTACIGHALHVLHMTMAAVLESPHYMGSMGSGSKE